MALERERNTAVQQLTHSPRPVPRGIIRPIDDDHRIAELERERERLERARLDNHDLDQLYDVLPARVGRGRADQRGMLPHNDRGGSLERGLMPYGDRGSSLERGMIPHGDRGSSLDRDRSLERSGGVRQYSTSPRSTVNNFSATEYLAHKQESQPQPMPRHSPRHHPQTMSHMHHQGVPHHMPHHPHAQVMSHQRRQPTRIEEPLYVNTSTAMGWTGYDGREGPHGYSSHTMPHPHSAHSMARHHSHHAQGHPADPHPQPPITKRIDSLPSVQHVGVGLAPGRDSARDARLSASVTLPDLYANR